MPSSSAAGFDSVCNVFSMPLVGLGDPISLIVQARLAAWIPLSLRSQVLLDVAFTHTPSSQTRVIVVVRCFLVVGPIVKWLMKNVWP